MLSEIPPEQIFSKFPYQEYSQRNTHGCADLPYPGSDGYGADDDFSIAEWTVYDSAYSGRRNQPDSILLIYRFSSTDYAAGRVRRPRTDTGKHGVVIASVYSLYACYASGSDAMVYGSLLTFAGWVIYGIMDRNDRQTIE